MEFGMRAKSPKCMDCPAYRVGRGFVPGRGPLGAKLALVGQGPGENEAWAGQPIVGPAGQHLDRWIVEANHLLKQSGCPRGLHRTDVWITNTVQCWLPKNREPTKAERDYCWEHNVAPELERLRDTLEVIVPIGVPAMEVIIGGRVGERTAGSLFRRDLDAVLSRATR